MPRSLERIKSDRAFTAIAIHSSVRERETGKCVKPYLLIESEIPISVGRAT